MPYASQADLETRFGVEELAQLTDRIAGTTPNATVIAAALADADALIEGYLAQRYALPVSPVPSLLRRLAADIARFLLHGKSAGEAVRQNYEDALALLRDLASGKAALAGAAPAPEAQAPAAAGGMPRHAAPERLLGRSRIGDYLG